MAIDHVPIISRDNAFLVSHPAKVTILKQSGVREHQRIRLIRAQLLDDFRKIVNMARAAGAIKPEFDKFSIVNGQFV